MGAGACGARGSRPCDGIPSTPRVGARCSSPDAEAARSASRRRRTRRRLPVPRGATRRERSRSRTSARSQNAQIDRPSPDLLDTIYICQQRQEWYRDFARSIGERAARRSSVPLRCTDRCRGDGGRACGTPSASTSRSVARSPTWTDALRRFIEQADALGVLVMVQRRRRQQQPPQARPGRVPRLRAGRRPRAAGVHQRRRHQGRADVHAGPRAGAHLARAVGAVGCAAGRRRRTHDVERWCNQVAAELLVPLASPARRVSSRRPTCRAELDRLARRFKVSTLVILRRMHDAGGLTRQQFWRAYEEELERLQAIAQGQRRRLLPDAGGAGSASGSPARWWSARSKGRRSTATPSACSASRSSRPSASSGAASASP